MLLHYFGKLESKFGENYTVLLKTCFILLALTQWNLNRFSQLFHCWKNKKIINKTTTDWKNFFRRSLELFMWAVQFASVSSCARTSPLEAFQLQMFFYDADNRWLRNACPLWYFMDFAVSSELVLLTQNHIVHLVSVFIRAGTRCPDVYACISELLEQPVNAILTR